MRTAAPPHTTTKGNIMLPVPRTVANNRLNVQIRIAPLKIKWE